MKLTLNLSTLYQALVWLAAWVYLAAFTSSATAWLERRS